MTVERTTETCIHTGIIWDSILELSKISVTNLGNRKSVSDFFSLTVYFNQGKNVGKHIPRSCTSLVFRGQGRYSFFVVSAYSFFMF